MDSTARSSSVAVSRARLDSPGGDDGSIQSVLCGTQELIWSDFVHAIQWLMHSLGLNGYGDPIHVDLVVRSC